MARLGSLPKAGKEINIQHAVSLQLIKCHVKSMIERS